MESNHKQNTRMESDAWIEDGILKINIKISTLSHAARNSEYFYACRESGYPLEIDDEFAFAMSVKSALNEASDDGSTPITCMLDAAFRTVVDSGEDGVKEISIQSARKDDKMTVLNTIMLEVEKATTKFPTWPTDPLHALAVVGEEFGELTKEVLQLTYEPHKTNIVNMRTEAIQTAAMAIRFCQSLDDYRFEQSDQHEQKGIQ